MQHNGKLSADRVAMLNEIGFLWEVKEQKLQVDWTTRYNDLVAFKEEHGHCFVPQNYKEKRNLGRWVNYTRNRGKSGKLSNERVAMLEEIGFVFNTEE